MTVPTHNTNLGWPSPIVGSPPWRTLALSNSNLSAHGNKHPQEKDDSSTSRSRIQGLNLPTHKAQRLHYHPMELRWCISQMWESQRWLGVSERRLHGSSQSLRHTLRVFLWKQKVRIFYPGILKSSYPVSCILLYVDISF